MKKTYQAPQTTCINISIRATILAGSPTTSGLDGFGGNGGELTGGSADARRGSLWDYDED